MPTDEEMKRAKAAIWADDLVDLLTPIINEGEWKASAKAVTRGFLHRRLYGLEARVEELETDWKGLRDAVFGQNDHPCVNRSMTEAEANRIRETNESLEAQLSARDYQIAILQDWVKNSEAQLESEKRADVEINEMLGKYERDITDLRAQLAEKTRQRDEDAVAHRANMKTLADIANKNLKDYVAEKAARKADREAVAALSLRVSTLSAEIATKNSRIDALERSLTRWSMLEAGPRWPEEG